MVSTNGKEGLCKNEQIDISVFSTVIASDPRQDGHHEVLKLLNSVNDRNMEHKE